MFSLPCNFCKRQNKMCEEKVSDKYSNFLLFIHSTLMPEINIKSLTIRYVDIFEENNPEMYNPQAQIHEFWDM